MSIFSQHARTMVLTVASALLAHGPLVSAQGPAPAASAGAVQNQPGPSDSLKSAAENMLKELDAHREMYRKDPAKLSGLVDQYLLPHFDVDTSARAVLGVHWRSATPDQRKRFVQAFYHSLLTNYGNVLIDFTTDNLKIFPANVAPSADRATVRTEIKPDSDDRVSVNFEMRKEPSGWKAVDVVVDGISYVKSYHDDFGAQIDQEGLEALIDRLERGDKPSNVNKTSKKTS